MILRGQARLTVRVSDRVRVATRVTRILNVFRGSNPVPVWYDCASVPLDKRHHIDAMI